MTWTVVTGGLVLILLVFICASLLHGMANTLDWVALHLHQKAKALRTMHYRRGNEIAARWVRDLEQAD